MALVNLPNLFRQHINQLQPIDILGETVWDILNKLTDAYPLLKPYLFDVNGAFNNFINIYLNGTDIRLLAYEKTLVNENDQLTIIPAIAGG